VLVEGRPPRAPCRGDGDGAAVAVTIGGGEVVAGGATLLGVDEAAGLARPAPDVVAVGDVADSEASGPSSAGFAAAGPARFASARTTSVMATAASAATAATSTIMP
jgi:hypothetical protein